MGQAAEVYAEQLGSLSLGYPLWFPESSASTGGPQIGDVGYVSNGRFWRLFNITVPRDHPWNTFGVPQDYIPFVIPAQQHHHEDNYLSPNLLHSRSLRAAKINSYVFITGIPFAQANISYQFECTNEHGAFLALNNKAERSSIDRSLTFERYIARNHRSWHDFVTKQGVRCDPGELVCVSGWVKTSEWTVAVFVKNERSHACSIQGQMGSFAGVGCDVTITNSDSMSPMYHSGPQTLAQSSSSSVTSGAQVNDQTIFIEFYKVKYRLRIPKVLKAAMGPPSDEYPEDTPATPAFDSDSDESVELEAVSPAENSAKTPLDHVLDHLLEIMPHADFAITSHGHLNDLLTSRSTMDFATGQTIECPQVEAGQDLAQDLRCSPSQVHLQAVDGLNLALLIDPRGAPLAPPDDKPDVEQISSRLGAIMLSSPLPISYPAVQPVYTYQNLSTTTQGYPSQAAPAYNVPHGATCSSGGAPSYPGLHQPAEGRSGGGQHYAASGRYADHDSPPSAGYATQYTYQQGGDPPVSPHAARYLPPASPTAHHAHQRRQGIPTLSNSIPSNVIHIRPFVNEDALHSHGAAMPQHPQGGVLPSSSGQPQPSQPSVPPSEEKKHICAICGRGFARSSSLETHCNSHTGKRPFECLFPGCDSRFSLKSNMLRHLRNHNTTE